MRILGIDGALNHSGWALLDMKDGEGWEGVSASKYGTIKVKQKETLGFKLQYIRAELVKLCKSLRPDIIVLEDVYSGPNKKTVARLNNAKGVFVLTVYDLLGKDPIFVGASEARSCLGLKNKEHAYSFFADKYKLKESDDDITDAYVLAWWYIKQHREECNIKKKSKRRIKKEDAGTRTRQKNNRKK